MTSKLPEDAFPFYVALGAGRSYDAVAEHFKVHKRTVVRSAAREKWPERLKAIEEKTREIVDAKLAEDRSEMDLRHRKLLRAMASRAAAAIQAYPLQSGMEGMKAAEMVFKMERILAGEPSETSAILVAQHSRDEVRRFVTTKPESDADWDELTQSDAPAG